MPVSFAFIFRAAVTLLLALHVFYMYCTARGMQATFGFHAGTSVVAGLFALAMLIPLVWAVALPELPEAFSHSIIPRRRWKRGRCPACNYDLRGMPRAPNDAPESPPPKCPECGREAREPPPPDMLQVSVRTAQRFITLNLLAWLLGCFAGEAIMLNDERLFREEVARVLGGSVVSHSRQRCWPNANCTLGYRGDVGFFATE